MNARLDKNFCGHGKKKVLIYLSYFSGVLNLGGNELASLLYNFF